MGKLSEQARAEYERQRPGRKIVEPKTEQREESVVVADAATPDLNSNVQFARGPAGDEPSEVDHFLAQEPYGHRETVRRRQVGEATDVVDGELVLTDDGWCPEDGGRVPQEWKNQ